MPSTGKREDGQRLSPEEAASFIAAGRRIAAHDLVRFSSGNCSWRVAPDLVALTAKGAWLGELTEAEIALCRLEDGEVLGEAAPSVEAGLHLGILRARPDVDVVLHCQPPAATAVACSRIVERSFDVIPEVPFYCGEVAVVEYLAPGSPHLAEAVTAAGRSHDVVVLRNHGLVVAGRDFTDVVQKAGFFELACWIVVHGHGVRPLAPGDAAALRERAAREV